MKDGSVEIVGRSAGKDGAAITLGKDVDDYLEFRTCVAAELVDGDGFAQRAAGKADHEETVGCNGWGYVVLFGNGGGRNKLDMDENDVGVGIGGGNTY